MDDDMKTRTTPGDLFRSIVKNPNFMTPQVYAYYGIPNGEVELSKGRGFMSHVFWGVTVVQYGRHDHDLSKLVSTYDEAIEYIFELRAGGR